MLVFHSCMRNGLGGRTDDLVASLDQGNYTVPLTAAFRRCRAQLPWWPRDLPSMTSRPLVSVHAAARTEPEDAPMPP